MAYRDFGDWVSVDVPTSGSSAVVTLAANAKLQYIVRKVIGSYTGGTPGGRLTIAYTPVGNQATVTIDIDINAQGEHPFVLDIVSALNTAVTITLVGVASSQGKLNVIYNKQAVTL